MESFNIVMRKDCLRMKRIGMLTSGGDCQALNAAMRGVVKGLSNNVDELEIYGFHNGYKGLIYGDYRLLTSADFSGILTKGGTILGFPVSHSNRCVCRMRMVSIKWRQ